MFKLLDRKSAEIHSLANWSRPKRSFHWKPGRSAMELASAWCRLGEPACPVELIALLDSHPLTRNTRFIEGSPEYVTELPERGEGRNHDLWLRAEARGAPLTVCLEAKVDEPFGPRICEYAQTALKRNSRSRAPERAKQLLRMIAGRDVELRAAPFSALRYQLLTAVVGTALQAALDGSQTAVFAVHEFRSHRVDPQKVRQNDEDLTAFVSALAGKPTPLRVGALVGPWPIYVATREGTTVDVLIGKTVTQID